MRKPLVSIDPGVDYCACAWWMPGVDLDDYPGSPALRGVKIVQRKDWGKLLGGGPDIAIIERPVIYRHGKAKTKDVEGLLIASGEIASHFQQVVWFTPRVWKGQQPKAAHQKKIIAACNENELAICEGLAKKDLKHIWDAVGLGLYYLGRLS